MTFPRRSELAFRGFPYAGPPSIGDDRKATSWTFPLLQSALRHPGSFHRPCGHVRLPKPSTPGFTHLAPPPTSPIASTPGKRKRSPSVGRCDTAALVPPSWFLTTSTVFSALGSPVLRPAASRGSLDPLENSGRSRHPVACPTPTRRVGIRVAPEGAPHGLIDPPDPPAPKRGLGASGAGFSEPKPGFPTSSCQPSSPVSSRTPGCPGRCAPREASLPVPSPRRDEDPSI